MTLRREHGKLSGFDDFDKLLKDLPARVENRVLQSAVTGALRDVRSDMRAAAPHNDGDQSPASKQYGPLRKNIRVIRLRRNSKGMRGARIDTGRAFWGRFIELGTRYIAAAPWFAPRFRSLREKIISSLGRRLGSGIEKEALRK